MAVLEGLQPDVLDFNEITDESGLRRVLREASSSPAGLCLVHARQTFDSLEDLGLLHHRVAALEPEDVALIMAHCGQPADQARSICAETQGHPAAVWARLGFPVDAPIPAGREQSLMAALSGGPLSVQMLSARLKISEHTLLDMAEPLLNQGAIIELEDGSLLGLPDRA
jgi:hypothetical protein